MPVSKGEELPIAVLLQALGHFISFTGVDCLLAGSEKQRERFVVSVGANEGNLGTHISETIVASIAVGQTPLPSILIVSRRVP